MRPPAEAALLWIPITIAAAAFQTARKAFQRGLTGELSALGATCPRFARGFLHLVARQVGEALEPGARSVIRLPRAGSSCRMATQRTLLPARSASVGPVWRQAASRPRTFEPAGRE